MHSLERLDEYLAQRELAAVWFARPASFAWLTGGNNVVDAHETVGVAAAGYDGDGVEVVTSTIEAARLAAEQLPETVTVVSYDWTDWTLSEMVADRTPSPAAADFDVPGLATVDCSPLRQPLTTDDIEAYRRLGTDVAGAVESACRAIDPTWSEQSVAATLTEALTASGITAPVVLVGGERRAQQYRHYTPTEAPLGEYALLSVTAERGGLHASTTRTVAFDQPEWLGGRHRTAAQIQTTALVATQREGLDSGPAKSVFAAIRRAYEALGYPDEWRRHHQGGAAGYAGREWIATPTLDVPVELPMAFAWNPTVHGAKSEDTWLVTGDGFECLTRTGEWERTPVEPVGYDRPLPQASILDRS